MKSYEAPIEIPACPVCAKDDRVQRVEEVYRAGYIPLPRPPMFGLAKYRRLDVSQIPGVSPLNLLSARLAPPVEPVYQGVFFSSSGAEAARFPQDWPAFIILAIRYAATAAVLGLLVSLLLQGSLGSWPGWLVFILALAVLFARRFRLEQTLAGRARGWHAQWEQHLAAWRKLNYCGRDELVFLPGSERTAAPPDWRQVVGA